MPLPKRVKFGPTNWDLVVKQDIEPLGRTQGDLTLIQVRTIGQSPAGFRDTVLHEMLHAVFASAAMTFTFGISDEDEERMVRSLTPWLLGFIRDNPKVVAFLQEK